MHVIIVYYKEYSQYLYVSRGTTRLEIGFAARAGGRQSAAADEPWVVGGAFVRCEQLPTSALPILATALLLPSKAYDTLKDP
jgi:hypothetical protein